MKTTLKATLDALQSVARQPLPQATAMPKDMYVSAEILALEHHRIFESGWLYAGRTDELPHIGDYMTFEHGSQPEEASYAEEQGPIDPIIEEGKEINHHNRGRGGLPNRLRS